MEGTLFHLSPFNKMHKNKTTQDWVLKATTGCHYDEQVCGREMGEKERQNG